MDIRTEAAIAAFVPSLAWLVLVYSRDRYEREPKRLIIRLYVMSVLAIAIAFVLESAAHVQLTGAVAVIVVSAIAVGLIEEGAKYSVVWLGTRRQGSLSEPVDGMIYASTVALGFAAIETLTYILRTYNVAIAYHLSPATAAHLALTVTAPSRALTGNLGHMSWAGIIGYAYGRWRCGMGSSGAVFRAYLAAAALHAGYDGLLGLNAAPLAYTVLVVSVLIYIHLFRHALAASPYRHQQWRSVPASAPPSGPPGHRATSPPAPGGRGVPGFAARPRGPRRRSGGVGAARSPLPSGRPPAPGTPGARGATVGSVGARAHRHRVVGLGGRPGARARGPRGQADRRLGALLMLDRPGCTGRARAVPTGPTGPRSTAPRGSAARDGRCNRRPTTSRAGTSPSGRCRGPRPLRS